MSILEIHSLFIPIVMASTNEAIIASLTIELAELARKCHASVTTSLVGAAQARPNISERRQPASADGHTLTERREACANAAQTRIGNLSSDCSTSEGGLYKGSSRPLVNGPSAKEVELDQPPSDSWGKYLRIRELTSEESNGKISRIGLRKGEFLIAKNSMVGDIPFADAFDMQRQCCYGAWKTL